MIDDILKRLASPGTVTAMLVVGFVAVIAGIAASAPVKPPPLTPGQAAHARECAVRWTPDWSTNPMTIAAQCEEAARRLLPVALDGTGQ